jgi:two-component system nitrogen regulation sensor histidine kinase GlnL
MSLPAASATRFPVSEEMSGAPRFLGLDMLTTPVILVDGEQRIGYANPAAENLLATSRRQIQAQEVAAVFGANPGLLHAIERARSEDASFTEHELRFTSAGGAEVELSITATPIDLPPFVMALEFQVTASHSRILREERMLNLGKANQALLRNLAHEIKNPLGGLRGAAQLLERELPDAGLREYTQVIIQEADRLQRLVERMLGPHRPPQMRPLNIHEVLERVRTLILAETPQGIEIQRDYDTSLPQIQGDAGQLIQTVLNIVRNAAQALSGHGEIVLRTRIARQVTLAMRRVPLAIRVDIIDNGPGVAEELRDRLFYPLATGRPEGTGLGLALAQNLMHQHQGAIEWDSRAGRTCFSLLLPLTQNDNLPNQSNHS